MKIITITGECGVGKDTLADKLVSAIPNSRHVAGDQFMFGSVKKYKSIVEEMFPNIQYLPNGDIDYMTVYRKGQKENEMFMPYIISHTSDCFDNAISQALKDNIDVLILQWVGIHKCNCWNVADLTIYMKASKAARHNALFARGNDGCDDEVADERDLHWEKTMETIENPDMVFNNNDYSPVLLSMFARQVEEALTREKDLNSVLGEQEQEKGNGKE